MELAPYLNFNGTCAEAFELYARVFGGTIVFKQTHGESPMKDHVPPHWHDKMMHMTLKVGGQTLMGSDAPPAHYQKPQGFGVSIAVPLADGQRIFDALAEKGAVSMPFQQTFWAKGFGMVTDQFGTPWMVNCE
jgi:PhnB protein